MSTLPTALLVLAVLGAPPAAPEDAAAKAAETRVVEYLRAHVRPGQPVVVSELHNSVFTAPEERAALDRLFNAFFKVPLFVAQQQQATGRPPTLIEIADRFRFFVPGEADLLLRILQADPRLPRFLERDAASGEITRVDVAAILADRRFGKALERTLAGWEGRPAAAFSARGEDGSSIGNVRLAGKPYLLYFWFSGCPPCTRTGPLLSGLQKEFGPRGLTIVALNADSALEVPVTRDERVAYENRNGWAFVRAEADEQTIEAWGAVSVFPTFFFVDRHGVVVGHLVSYQEAEVLQQAADRALR